ncbi:MAG: alpha/beta hydrolase [Oscillospiraceae bacterium]
MKKDYIEEYVIINGIKQYFLHYPQKNSDKVILYIHGGPGRSKAHFAYYAKEGRDFCNFVYYDQRGTGKTQFMNSCPEITTNDLIDDLKKIIDYLKVKYRTEKIFLLGHSWGTVIGAKYVSKYPKTVSAYIGMGQVVDMSKSEEVRYNKLVEAALSKEGITESDKKLLEKFKDKSKESLAFHRLQTHFGFGDDYKKMSQIYLKSPIFRFFDFIPLINVAPSKNLFKALYDYNAYENTTYDLPVYFICGRNDWAVPSLLTKEYYNAIKAPEKGLFWVENTGHYIDIDNPAELNLTLKNILKKY